ncbi:Methyltransferase ustM [Pseudocercospora fuligena]|uniref:Methyltransferase ustM n=1 Tax=Pseudocercospora fuligena TaxID=685502 RepID=A0A8H6R818_9PEZI|nr:Methyltransferase ustM [Pseudocercospora fuligena]
MVDRDTATLEALQGSPVPPKTSEETGPLDPFLADTPDLAERLAKYTISGDTPTQTSQLQHRLDILATCYPDENGSPSLHHAREALKDRSILEIGCGQGDMTVALAHFVSTGSSNTGKVFAIDPASADYGSPFTLGQAQDFINKGNIGPWVKFVKQDPQEYVKGMKAATRGRPDVIVLAHSIFYLESEEYFKELLTTLFGMASERKSSRPIQLVLAEWGMRTEREEARAHVLASEIQAGKPMEQGNVRIVVRPERILELAEEVGWELVREKWIEKPEMEDGKWEVGIVKKHYADDDLEEEAKAKLEEMKSLAESGEVRSMDVWTGVFEP